MKAERRMNPTIDPDSFGNIALEWGWLTMDDLQSALLLQEQRRPIGMILIEMGKLTEMQVEEIVCEQELRKAHGKIEVSLAELGHQRRLIHIMSHGLADVAVTATGMAAALGSVLKR